MELPSWASRAMEARGLTDPAALWDSSLEAPEAYRAALHSAGLKTRAEEKAAQERNSRAMEAGNALSEMVSQFGAETILSWVHGREAADVAASEASFRVADLEARLKEAEARAPPEPEAPQEARAFSFAEISRALCAMEAWGIYIPSPDGAEAAAVHFLSMEARA